MQKINDALLMPIILILMMVVFISYMSVNDLIDNSRISDIYTISLLNSAIENSEISTQLKFNTYNTNFIGANDFYIYCNLSTEIQSLLIKTYYHNFKDEISFYDFIYEYGYSSYYLFTEKI